MRLLLPRPERSSEVDTASDLGASILGGRVALKPQKSPSTTEETATHSEPSLNPLAWRAGQGKEQSPL